MKELKTEEQFRLYPSRDVCRAMPLEPAAWYGLRVYTYDDYGGHYEWGALCLGSSLGYLHRLLDTAMNTGIVDAFMWIQRLTDKEVEELDL